MEPSYEELKNELDNLKKIVFRIMDFSFPTLKAEISHYDFINDEVVRRQLELDFLKMMQTPASNFIEYCQYSFFQIENLINYYYSLRFTTKDEMSEYFSFNGRTENYERISEIKYSVKWSKFAMEFLVEGDVLGTKRKTINYDIQKIAYVRNSSIHRNTKNIKAYENSILKNYKRLPGGRWRNDHERSIWKKAQGIMLKRDGNFALVKKRTAEFLKLIEKEIIKYQ